MSKPKKTVIELPKEINRIIGLDLSLNHTGFAEYNLDMDQVIGYGTLESGKLRGAERLGFVKQSVTNRLRPAEGFPLFLIEGYAFGAKGDQAYQIGELGGLIRHLLWEVGSTVMVVTPTQLKKYVTGKGTVEKNLILKEVYKRFGYDVEDDNVADALVLMELGRALVNDTNRKLTEWQKVIINDLLCNSAQV
jgi:Holliday junction resolvasome RuvABC endonuclease subunit